MVQNILHIFKIKDSSMARSIVRGGAQYGQQRYFHCAAQGENNILLHINELILYLCHRINHECGQRCYKADYSCAIYAPRSCLFKIMQNLLLTFFNGTIIGCFISYFLHMEHGVQSELTSSENHIRKNALAQHK